MSGPAVPSIRKYFDKLERLEWLRTNLSRQFDQEHDISHCLIGGFAVADWVSSVDDGFARSTKDVNFVVRRADAEVAEACCWVAGLIVEENPVGLTCFDPWDWHDMRRVFVHWAGEIAGNSTRFPDPDDRVRAPSGHYICDLGPLLYMKLGAFRLVDQVHVQDLFKVGLITPELARQLPIEFQDRLRQVRDTLEWDATPRPEF